VEDEVSWFYVANEVRNVSGGMDVALDDDVWTRHPPAPDRRDPPRIGGVGGDGA
jgi:hypothetical protein